MDYIGVDIKSSWDFNDQGDLLLVRDEENMVQAVTNRLTCWLSGLDLYYLEYGSVLTSFLGWKREDETLKFMRIELDNTLKQDPRMPDYDLDLEFNDNGGINMHLALHFNDMSDVEMSLVITEDGSINLLNDDTVE